MPPVQSHTNNSTPHLTSDLCHHYHEIRQNSKWAILPPFSKLTCKIVKVFKEIGVIKSYNFGAFVSFAITGVSDLAGIVWKRVSSVCNTCFS